MPNDQWRQWVVYQVYPRSFADSNGDGAGDTEAISDGGASLKWEYMHGGHLELAMGLRTVALGPGAFEPDPSVEQEAAVPWVTGVGGTNFALNWANRIAGQARKTPLLAENRGPTGQARRGVQA